MKIRDLKSEELKTLIKEKPITEQIIKSTLENKVSKTIFTNEHNCDSMCFGPLRTGKYHIWVSLNYELEVQKISFVHELAHVYYDVSDSNGLYVKYRTENQIKISKLLTEESKRFCKIHKNFIDKFYYSLRSNLTDFPVSFIFK